MERKGRERKEREKKERKEKKREDTWVSENTLLSDGNNIDPW